MDKKLSNEKIGFFSRSYAFNRHKRLLAYSTMLPEAKLVLFTTNRLKDISKWNGVKNLEVVELKPNLRGYFKLIRYCRDNKLRYISNLGHPKSLPIILINKLINGTKYIVFRGLYKGNILDYLVYSMFADKIQVNDTKLYDKLKNSIHRDKVYYLPAPTDTDFYSPRDKNSARKALGLPVNKKIVLFVGRVNKNKGSEFLLSAIKANKDITFAVVGSITDERFLNLKDENYIYLGKREGDELVNAYCAADLGLFVIAIEGGGLAMTAHECLACGTPILISKRKDYMAGEGIFPVEEETHKVNLAIKKFFDMNVKERGNLVKKSRQTSIDICSIDKFKSDYRKLFLDKD